MSCPAVTHIYMPTALPMEKPGNGAKGLELSANYCKSTRAPGLVVPLPTLGTILCASPKPQRD